MVVTSVQQWIAEFFNAPEAGSLGILLIGIGVAYLIAGALFGFSQQSRGTPPYGEAAGFAALATHAAMTGALSWILCGIWNSWQLPVGVLLIHLLSGLIFWAWRRKYVGLWWFAGLHLSNAAALAVLALAIAGQDASFETESLRSQYLTTLTVIGAIIASWSFCSELLAHAVRPLLDELEERRQNDPDSKGSPGLRQAGKMIGGLERLLILVLILADHIEAIGFLVAAKSIFRFGELSNSEHRMESEYIIIGTLTSFVVGIAVALTAALVMSSV